MRRRGRANNEGEEKEEKLNIGVRRRGRVNNGVRRSRKR
jgi:hypothetical protein